MIGSAELVIKVKWTWGAGKVISVRSFDIVGEAFELNGIKAVENCRLFAFCKGQPIRLDLSFSFQKLNTGDVIILTMKKQPDSTKKQRFLDSLSQRSNINHDMRTILIDFDKIKSDQIAKMNDLAFQAWENSPEFPNLLVDLHKAQQLEDSMVPIIEKTIIPDSPVAVSTAPLPICAEAEDFSVYGLLRNEITYSKGYFTEQRKGGYLGDVKKQ